MAAQPFLLMGNLYKLKHRPPVLGGAWNERYFVVEERRSKTGIEYFFSYYPSSAKSSNVRDAGDAVLLQDICHVSLLSESGRLDLYTSAASTMDDRTKKELAAHRELILEVETLHRPYFLRANSRHDLLMWVAGLQRVAALPVTTSWPGDCGPPLDIPEQVVRARVAQGTLSPEVRRTVEHILAPRAASSVAVATAAMPAAPTMASAEPRTETSISTASTASSHKPAAPPGMTAHVQQPASSRPAPEQPRPVVAAQPVPAVPAAAAARSTSGPGATKALSAVSSTAATVGIAGAAQKPAQKPREITILDADEDDDEPVSSIAAKGRGSAVGVRASITGTDPSPRGAGLPPVAPAPASASGRPPVDPRTLQNSIEAAISTAAARRSSQNTADTSSRKTSMSAASDDRLRSGSSTRPQSAAERKTGSIVDDFDDEDDDAAPRPAVRAVSSTGATDANKRSVLALASPVHDTSPVAPTSWISASHDGAFAPQASRKPSDQELEQAPPTKATPTAPKGVIGNDRDWGSWDDDDEEIKRPAGVVSAPASKATITRSGPAVGAAKPALAPAPTQPTLAAGKRAGPGEPSIAMDADFVESNWDDE